MNHQERVSATIDDAPGRYVHLGAHVILDQRIKHLDRALYGLITFLAGRGTACVVRREDLARCSGVTPGTVDRSLERLVQFGYIAIHHRGREGLRIVLLPPTADQMVGALGHLTEFGLITRDDLEADRGPAHSLAEVTDPLLPAPAQGRELLERERSPIKTTAARQGAAASPQNQNRREVVSRATADLMRQFVADTSRLRIDRDWPRLVHWTQIEPWLDDGVTPETILWNWSRWLLLLTEDRDTDLDATEEGSGNPYLGREGSLWFAFARWVLTGGSFRTAPRRYRLPQHWYDFERRAAQTVRTNATRRRNHDDPTATAHLWWVSTRASLSAIGAAALSLAEADNNAIYRDPDYPTRRLTRTILWRLHAERDAVWFDDILEVVNATDEALDRGFARAAQTFGTGTCTLGETECHDRKHAAISASRGCGECGCALALLCETDVRDPLATNRAIMHDGILVCSDCEAGSFWAQLQE